MNDLINHERRVLDSFFCNTLAATVERELDADGSVRWSRCVGGEDMKVIKPDSPVYARLEDEYQRLFNSTER